MKKTIAINGQFTTRRLTGMERFAYDLTLALDKIADDTTLDMRLVVPKNAVNIPELHSIKVVRYGKAKGSLWEQIFMAAYCIRHNATSFTLRPIMPLLTPGVVCIHDILYKTHPGYFTTPYARLSRLWCCYHYWAAKHFSPLIYTVSNFTKRELMDIYGIEDKRIVVLGNGWEHFTTIKSDDTLARRHPEWVADKPFFFSLGSLAPHKNIKWILEVAKRHKQYNFLIGGNASLKAYGTDYSDANYANVKFIGYITDEEVKYLMEHCKAFLFPSLYEGFGLPPLEALSMGAEIVVSNAACLPEIYGDSAHYIDPRDTDVNLDELLKQPVGPREKVLEKYNFTRYARLTADTLEQLP